MDLNELETATRQIFQQIERELDQVFHEALDHLKAL